MSTHHCMHCDCANNRGLKCCFCGRTKANSDEDALVAHARREVAFLKAERWLEDGLIGMVQAYAAMGHDAKDFALPLLAALLDMELLVPITDDPNEWRLIEDDAEVGVTGGHWQNIRETSAFSENGGKTYFLLTESLANPSEDLKFHESAKSGKINTNISLDEAVEETQDAPSEPA